MSDPAILFLIPFLLLSLVLGGGAGWAFRQQISTLKERSSTERTRSELLQVAHDGYRNAAEAAVRNLEEIANNNRVLHHQPPLPGALVTIPEHSSPVTQAQQDVADLSSLVARLAVVSADLSSSAGPAPAIPLAYEEGVQPRITATGGASVITNTPPPESPDTVTSAIKKDTVKILDTTKAIKKALIPLKDPDA